MEAVQVMSQLKHIKNYARLVYKNCVESVNPKILIKKELVKRGNHLIIRGNQYELKNNCYIVGFGKAVLDMAVATEEILRGHVREGAISIPVGLLSQKNFTVPKSIQIFEGAKNNVPDYNALFATQSIVKMLEPLKEEDLVIALVSGGGSALLTNPEPPLTLEEKLLVIKSLSEAGANILELNAVRKSLSLVKGGKLAKIVYPAKLVTLVLSDVVNDPLDMIASGPTVQNMQSPTLAMDVLKKYNLNKAIPSSVLEVLTKTEIENRKKYFDRSITHIIGNNTLALNAGVEFTNRDGYISKVMTNSLEGPVDQIALTFAKLAGLLCQALCKTINNKVFESELKKLGNELSITNDTADDFIKLISESVSKNKLCLFFGGETTVKVVGKGDGGRNQELALRFSIALEELSKSLHVIDLFNIVMLCAGTDGIDGPTDAAGAISYNGQTQHALLQNLIAEQFVKENNSYNYYKTLNNGEDLLKYGLTGTNVMDLCILTVESKL